MWLNKLIIKEAVITDLSAKTKEEALRELLQALKNCKRLSQIDTVLQDLLLRERKSSSGIGQGIAIPHACTAEVHQPMIVMGISRQGVDFKSADNNPVHLVFMVLGRINGNSLQLKILGRLAHLLSTPEVIESLKKFTDAEQILSFLTKEEQSFGELENPQDLPSVCVVGAGNGGLAMAGHLALIGCRVNLFNRSEQRLDAVKLFGGIQVTGEVHGFAKLNVITSDAGKALAETDLVMVVVPATGHQEMARLLAPHLVDGQVVVLNPGRTGGALEFSETLRQRKIKTYFFLAEAETLIYACRIVNPGQVRIFGIKNAVPVATLPAYYIPDVLATLRKILPQFSAGDNVLKTSLNNIGAVFHPALTVLNVAWIEQRRGNFEYYHEGASPSLAKVLEAIDAERVKVAEALGIRVPTAKEWLYQAYGIAAPTLYEAMLANKGYRGIKAPSTLDHRYITEDVPTSLVPIASLGDHLGVPVPTLKMIIHLASILHSCDYAAEGRTVKRLGLEGLNVRQIRRLVEEGRRG